MSSISPQDPIKDAYRETGYAMAALKVGLYVPELRLAELSGLDISDDGAQELNAKQAAYRALKQPMFQTVASHREAVIAWKYNVESVRDMLFVLLSGPQTNAKLSKLGKKDTFAEADLRACEHLVQRLEAYADEVKCFISEADLQRPDMLSKAKSSSKRWLGQAKVWRTIELVAKNLAETHKISGHRFCALVGEGQTSDENLSLF